MDTFTGKPADPGQQPDAGQPAGEAAEPAASSIPMPPFPGEIRFDPKQKKPNDTVKIWQNSLRARGYTALKVDGYFGKYTAACVIDWQTVRPQARNVDGVCKVNMWRDLTTNPAPRAWGPCSSGLCPSKGRPPGAMSSDEALEPSAEAMAYVDELIPDDLPDGLTGADGEDV